MTLLCRLGSVSIQSSNPLVKAYAFLCMRSESSEELQSHMFCLSAREAAAYFLPVCNGTKYSAVCLCCLLHPQTPAAEEQQELKAAGKWDSNRSS